MKTASDEREIESLFTSSTFIMCQPEMKRTKSVNSNNKRHRVLASEGRLASNLRQF